MLTYRCSTCDDGFATMEELLKHDATSHSIPTGFMEQQNQQNQPNPTITTFINQVQ